MNRRDDRFEPWEANVCRRLSAQHQTDEKHANSCSGLRISTATRREVRANASRQRAVAMPARAGRSPRRDRCRGSRRWPSEPCRSNADPHRSRLFPERCSAASSSIASPLEWANSGNWNARARGPAGRRDGSKTLVQAAPHRQAQAIARTNRPAKPAKRLQPEPPDVVPARSCWSVRKRVRSGSAKNPIAPTAAGPYF